MSLLAELVFTIMGLETTIRGGPFDARGLVVNVPIYPHEGDHPKRRNGCDSDEDTPAYWQCVNSPSVMQLNPADRLLMFCQISIRWFASCCA